MSNPFSRHFRIAALVPLLISGCIAPAGDNAKEITYDVNLVDIEGPTRLKVGQRATFSAWAEIPPHLANPLAVHLIVNGAIWETRELGDFIHSDREYVAFNFRIDVPGLYSVSMNDYHVRLLEVYEPPHFDGRLTTGSSRPFHGSEFELHWEITNHGGEPETAAVMILTETGSRLLSDRTWVDPGASVNGSVPAIADASGPQRFGLWINGFEEATVQIDAHPPVIHVGLEGLQHSDCLDWIEFWFQVINAGGHETPHLRFLSFLDGEQVRMTDPQGIGNFGTDVPSIEAGGNFTSSRLRIEGDCLSAGSHVLELRTWGTSDEFYDFEIQETLYAP